MLLETSFVADEQRAGECRVLAQRAAAGSQLGSSPRLREFLLYIVDCALRDRPEEATEQQIGVHVFGRRPGYNSGDDSIVRSQARLLRMKLRAYFENEGAHETIVIEIPKGHYLPVFHDRDSTALSSLQHAEEDLLAHAPDALDPEPADTPLSSSAEVLPPLHSHSNGNGQSQPSQKIAVPLGDLPESAHTPGRRGLGHPLVITLLVLAGLTLGLVAGLLIPRHRATSWDSSDPFWSPFLSSPTPPLVIYSNPVFRGTPDSGLFLADPDQAQISEIAGQAYSHADETYTGIGEAEAIYTLTRFFDQHLAAFTLKRSRLVTWDEARSRSLIFVGASSQNTALRDLPDLTEFTVSLDTAGHGYLVNQHPTPGEAARFPAVGSTSAEFAIIALLPGLELGKRVLIFSGLTTLGTQAAVEFACRPENWAALLRQAGVSSRLARPFEAVLEIRVSKGVAIGSRLVALHAR